MQGVCFPCPTDGQLIDTMHLYAAIAPGPFRQKMRSRIGRAIIDEGDIEVWIILRQERSNTGIDGGLFVAYRHNDGDVWRRFWQGDLTRWVCFPDGSVCSIALPECNQCRRCEGDKGEVLQGVFPLRAGYCLTRIHGLLFVSICMRSHSYVIIE